MFKKGQQKFLAENLNFITGKGQIGEILYAM